MSTWPPTWRTRALETASIPVTSETLAVLRAWKKSTPLPSLTSNPLGMPSGTLGAPKYLNTKYAIFPSMSAFYAAFASFADSHDGRNLIQAMLSDQPYSATWRFISNLNWPGSTTETDYPSALLDLTEQAYRDSVGASDPADRKTSGRVGRDPQLHAAIIGQARAVTQAAQSFNDSTKAIQHLVRKYARNA